MTKYGAKKTEVDGIKFDSKAESRYYATLQEKKRIGLIEDFELQPEFVIFEGFTDQNGKKHRSIKYRADFLIRDNYGIESVIDVKGVKTEAYKMKKKMFIQRYPQYKFVEIQA